LGCRPEKITALLSANILKNAMGVPVCAAAAARASRRAKSGRRSLRTPKSP